MCLDDTVTNTCGEQSVSTIVVEWPIDPRTCHHEEVEPLGSEGGAAFFRCVACGSIVIAQGSHRWIIRLTDEAGPLPF